MTAPEKPTKFRFWCQKVLPAVYDDSLSYYETICKIADSLDKCIDYLNYLDKEVITWDELNPKLDNLQGQIDVVNATLRDYKNHLDNLDGEIERLDTRITEELQTMREWVLNQIELHLASLEMYLKGYADSGDQHVLNVIKTEISKIYDVIEKLPMMEQKLFNPTKGYEDDASDTVEDVYEFTRYLGLTSLEFQVLGKTVEQLEGESKTARWEDTAGRLLHDYCLWKNGFDPTTGTIRSYQDEILTLFQMFGNSAKITDIDDSMPSVSTFESYSRNALNLGLYSWDADFNQPTNLGVAPYNHADISNIYGASSTEAYGHVKLATSINATDNSLAVTPKLVYDFVKAELKAAGLD